MAGDQRDLESGLTRFLAALYACFRFLSKILICFTWCSCDRTPSTGKHKASYSNDHGQGNEDGSSQRTFFSKNLLGQYSFPKRYILVIMTFLGFVNMYALRVNLNVALEAMVNNHTIQQKGVIVVREAEFYWDSKMQGVVLASFYYGYAFLQLPGGILALEFGGTRIFGYAIFLASLFTLFTPVATRFSVYGLIGVRACEGLVLGVIFPCNHAIWSKWAPSLERTTLVTLAISGCHVGTILTMPLIGLLTKYGFDGGWSSVFYCFGVAGILWFAAWQLIVHESPDDHPTISEAEKEIIKDTLATTKEHAPIPWRSILTSGPVWGIIFGHLASDWGLYTILICLPMYLLDILHFDIQTVGFMAATPFLVKALSEPLGGVTTDLLRQRYLNTKSVRRLFFTMGAMGAGVFIVAASYARNATTAVVCMCIGVAASGLMHSGFTVNMLDIASEYACVIMGISNTIGTIPGFLSPMFVDFMTSNKTAQEWRTVFWVTFIVYVIGTCLFCLLMSGERQVWASGLSQENRSEEAIQSKIGEDSGVENL